MNLIDLKIKIITVKVIPADQVKSIKLNKTGE